MNSEESYNPYHSLHDAPNVSQWPQDNIPTTFVESPQIAKRTRAWALLIVPAMFLLIIITLLCTMLIWLLYRHVDFDPSFEYVTNNALVVDEAAQWCQLLAIASHGNCDPNQAPSLLGLTLSGVLSKIISFSITYVMAMAMLCAGSSWLRATSARETRDMPTPLQYALLITMASGTFASAWEGWSYLIWRQKRRPRAPFLVKGTFASLIILLLLSSVVDIADTWLHFSTTTVSLHSTYPIADHQALEPSLALNSTLCTGATFENTCVFSGRTYAGPPAVQDVGNNVAANASAAFQVLTFGSTGTDLTSVIVPTTSIPSGVSFRSTSYGMGATCKPASCESTFIDGNWSPSIAPDGLHCTVDGSMTSDHTLTFSVPSDPSQVTGPSFLTYNLQGSQYNVTELDSLSGSNVGNPFGFAQLMRWATELTDGSDYLHVWDYGSENITWFMGGCNISVYDVELSYTNGTYNLIDRTLSAENTATMLFLPFVGDYFLTSFASRMVVNLANQLNNNHTDFLIEVARQVSQLGIGLNAGLFMPTQLISDVKMEKVFLASRYQINALGVLWAATVFYVILGVGLLIRAVNEQGDTLLIEPVSKSSTLDSDAHSASTTSTLLLAQQRVANPSAIVAEHFILSTSGGYQFNALAPALSIQNNVMDIFGDEKGEDRLGIGFHSELSSGINERLRKRVFCVGYQD